MAFKPILFNTEMSRAVLDGRKTVTRRAIKPQPTEHLTRGKRWRELLAAAAAPYSVGDILWVRETWCKLPVSPGGNARINGVYYYKADGDLRPDGWRGKWRPSIHMPTKAARTFLRVTGVRVERLQDITTSEAYREGANYYCHETDAQLNKLCRRQRMMDQNATEVSITAHFSLLWDSTIKKADIPLYGWDVNPWVWVIEFEQCERPEGF